MMTLAVVVWIIGGIGLAVLFDSIPERLGKGLGCDRHYLRVNSRRNMGKNVMLAKNVLKVWRHPLWWLVIALLLVVSTCATFTYAVTVDDEDLPIGGVHKNDYKGSVVANLKGHYLVVVKADYDNRTMSVVVIDQDTMKVIELR